MSYFAGSAWNYLAGKIDRFQKDAEAGRRLLVIVPSLPEYTMLTLGETFTNRCLPDATLELTIKIAQVVLKDWSPQGTAKARQHD